MCEKKIALVGLRLISIYIVIQLINLIPNWVSTLYVTLSNPFSISLIAVETTLLILSLAIPVVLWIAAKFLVNYIVDNHNDDFTSPPQSNNTRGFATIMFASIGILVFILTFPDLIVWLCQLFIALSRSTHTYIAPKPSLLELITFLLKLSFSYILIAKADFINKLISTKKT